MSDIRERFFRTEDDHAQVATFIFPVQMIFFSAALLVLSTSVLSLITSIMEAAPVKVIVQIYLVIFGFLMMVIDIPEHMSHSFLTDMKYAIYRNLLCLTRFTGRGLWYLFLGSMLFVSLYKNHFLLSVVCGIPVSVLGVGATIHGIRKTRELEALRQSLKFREQEDSCPEEGLSKTEFCKMAVDMRGQMWDPEMMIYVFNALSLEIKADDHISRDEFLNWMEEPLPMLL